MRRRVLFYLKHRNNRHALLIIVCLFFSSSAFTISPNGSDLIQDIMLKEHVKQLSSDAMEGRLTGTLGEKRATKYIANIFRNLELLPMGDHGTFFQTFPFISGVTVGKNNTLLLHEQNGLVKQLQLNTDWYPLTFSDSLVFKNPELIFVGVGLTLPATDTLPSYDSYHGLNVKNKWVVVLKDIPESLARERQINPYSSLRYRAFTAKKQGAKGIVFIMNERDSITSLSSDASFASSGITALLLREHVLNRDMYQPKSRLHHVKLAGQIDIQKNTRYGRNVLAKLKFGPNNRDIIVIGAHADHLGHGEIGSRARNNENGLIHSGADDNASGVASILEIAAQLSDLKAHGKLHGDKDILFAAWSGEELGVLGSSYFIRHAIKTKQYEMIDAAINLDMVGHLNKSLILQGVGSSLNWPAVIHKTQMSYPISIITQYDPYLPTDATPFYLQHVPVLNFFSGVNDDYHTPRDKPETLNYAGIKKISEFLMHLVFTLEKEPSVHYSEVKKTNLIQEQQFKIYLGTIPDYTHSDVAGVALSGVTKHSPAEKAGLMADDIIIELKGVIIHNIYDYMFVLNTLPVGKSVKIVVLREQKRKTLTIVAQHRE